MKKIFTIIALLGIITPLLTESVEAMELRDNANMSNAITQAELHQLLKAPTNVGIRELRLDYFCPNNIQDKDLELIAEKCPSLENLNLCGCKKLTPAGFQAITKLKNLRVLNISTTDIDDAAVIAIAQNCPLLVELNLSWCNKLTTAGFQAIAKLKNLRVLGTYTTYNIEHRIDDTAIRAILNNCQELKNFYFFGAGVSEELKQELHVRSIVVFPCCK